MHKVRKPANITSGCALQPPRARPIPAPVTPASIFRVVATPPGPPHAHPQTPSNTPPSTSPPCSEAHARRHGEAAAQRGQRIAAANIGRLGAGAQAIAFTVRPHSPRLERQQPGPAGWAPLIADVRCPAGDPRPLVG